MRAAVVTVLVLAACGTTTTYRVPIAEGGAPAMRSADAVQVLLEGSSVPSNYVEVAVVQAIGRGTHSDIEHVVNGLRAEAAALRCDAVIAVHVDSGATQTSGVGVAVRWRAGVPQASTARPLSTPWAQGSGITVPPWAATQP